MSNTTVQEDKALILVVLLGAGAWALAGAMLRQVWRWLR